MRPMHMLMIEDNEGDILLAQEALEHSKIIEKISIANNGEQAMEILNQSRINPSKRPDLILLDINLPKKDGHQVLKEIKENTELKTIPVIILTTSSSSRDIEKAYKGHVNSYIIKPMDGEHYINIINQVENYWTTTVALPHK